MTPSDDLLHRLARISPIKAFLIALVVLLAGLFLPGIVGGAVLFVLAAGLATLTSLTWPVQQPATRAVRVLMLVLLFAAAVAKVV